MSVKMKFGSKDIPFVYKGDKLVYPNPIKDGLLLWYDFKGMRNTDITKEVARDLSGNGNDGTLTNFNFTEESGYKDNTLVFDGVDDSLTIPELVLDETAMTAMHDGKLYAYEDDKVLTVGEDGEIVGSGKNLVKDSNNLTFLNFSGSTHLKEIDESGYTRVTVNPGDSFIVLMIMVSHLKRDYPNREITISMDIINHGDAFNLVHNWANSAANGDVPVGFNGRYKFTGVAYEPAAGQIQFRTKYNPPINGLDFSIRNFKAEVGTENKGYSLAPSDYKSTTLSPTSLTDLQLYNKTLHKDELLHNAESKGLKKLKPGVIVQDGLLLHYDFSHESNTSEYKGKAFDYSGNGNHGELQNFNFTEESGYESKGLKFEGVDDYIDAGNDASLQITRNLTLEALFYVNPLDVNIGSILVKGDNSGWANNSYGIRQATTNNAHTVYKFFIYGDDANNHQNRVDISVPTGEIVHLSAQADFDKGEMIIYRNGQLYYTHKMVGIEAINTKGENLKVGSGYYSSFLNGNIYSTKVYNRALTPEEITHNYTIEKDKFNIAEGEM